VYKTTHLYGHLFARYRMSNMASDVKEIFSSKEEYRAVIRYLHLKGKTGEDIHVELVDVYGSSAPSYSHVKFWAGGVKT